MDPSVLATTKHTRTEHLKTQKAIPLKWARVSPISVALVIGPPTSHPHSVCHPEPRRVPSIKPSLP